VNLENALEQHRKVKCVYTDQRSCIVK